MKETKKKPKIKVEEQIKNILLFQMLGHKDTMQEDEKIVYKEEHKKDAVVLAKLKYHNDDHMLQSEIEDSLSKELKDPNHPNPFDRRK